MFEDEMTEEHLARTGDEYRRVTEQDKHDEQIAIMRAYIVSLEATVSMLKYKQTISDRGFLAYARSPN